MMMDQDSAFMLSLMSYVLKKLGINIKTVGPYNHKSLQAEWHKILVEYTIQMFDRSGADMAQISVISHICLQYISYTQFRKLFPISTCIWDKAKDTH